MAYSDTQQLFIDLIKYNEDNIELVGPKKIQVTNIYYITLLDLSDDDITKYINYITKCENENPFNNFSSNMNIDEEQIHNINIKTINSFRDFKIDIASIFKIANESNSKIVLVIDIGFLFDLIKKSKTDEEEIHLYDFLLHIFKKQIDKLFILDIKNILVINNKHSSVLDELRMYMCKENIMCYKETNKSEVIIYKKIESMYWSILKHEQKIEYIQKNRENDEIAIIDGDELMINTILLHKICFTNLFELHTMVLDPIDKLNTCSVFKY
jgi:hypothetical protein